MLELLEGKRNGYFLDSGAADGRSSSNTLLLETEYEWNGICVEPNPELFAELTRHRRCHCVNACLYDRDGDVEFVDARFLGGIRETYAPSQLRFLHTRPSGPPPIVRRPTRTLRSVLREFNAPAVIDYWSLDTEGSELKILQSFPFDTHQVRVLTVEHNRRPDYRAHIRELLERHGYRLLKNLDIDDCYTLGVTAGPPMWRSYSRRLRR